MRSAMLTSLRCWEFWVHLIGLWVWLLLIMSIGFGMRLLDFSSTVVAWVCGPAYLVGAYGLLRLWNRAVNRHVHGLLRQSNSDRSNPFNG